MTLLVILFIAIPILSLPFIEYLLNPPKRFHHGIVVHGLVFLLEPPVLLHKRFILRLPHIPGPRDIPQVLDGDVRMVYLPVNALQLLHYKPVHFPPQQVKAAPLLDAVVQLRALPALVQCVRKKLCCLN